ncbi:MAG: DUF4476 domain-containing protein [Sphingobacteriales bacterium]|nr:MAG: DUF4476 domain-containing protein [Sphingobacteriales bacterium]
MNTTRTLLKPVVALLGLLALQLTVNAQQRRGTGELDLTAENGESLSVEIDGRRFDRFGTHLMLRNIPAGRKRIVIYRLKPHNYDRGATAQTVYEGNLLIQPNRRSRMSINPSNGNMRVVQEDLYPATVAAGDPAPASAPTEPAVPEPHSYSGTAATTAPRWSETIAGKRTDTEKLPALKAYVSGHSLTTQELQQMLPELLFEESRLALATAAIPNVTDRERLSDITATFEAPANRKMFETALKQTR